MVAGLTTDTQALAVVEVFDGTRQPYIGPEQILLTAIDGNDKTILSSFFKEPAISLSLPFHDNLQDKYTFIAFADGYRQAGFTPVWLSRKVDQSVKLMLLPDENSFSFARARWNSLNAARPLLAAILANGAADDNAAGARYSELEESGPVLACLLNIATAMAQIFLPQGTPLDYLKAVNWDLSGNFRLAQDRFFGWADPAIIPQLEAAKAHGAFVDAPAGLHPGATRSYKQVQFGEANVQLTFHEGDRLEIDGLNCVRIEPDIDYFRDTGAHLLLEVAVNAFGALTDPRMVYVLRWIAGQRAGIPEFDPLYTIIQA